MELLLRKECDICLIEDRLVHDKTGVNPVVIDSKFAFIKFCIKCFKTHGIRYS